MTIFSRTALALLVVLLCSPRTASADTIQPTSPVVVGTFNFVSQECDRTVDPFCENQEYFSVTNDLDASDPLYGGLTFFGAVDLGGTLVDLIDASGNGYLAAGDSAITAAALQGFYFSSAALATLSFAGGTFADYGTLFLSGPLSPASSLATLYLDPVQSTPEPASIVLLTGGLALMALWRRARLQKSLAPCTDLEKARPTR